jgi:hypothetical protein
MRAQTIAVATLGFVLVGCAPLQDVRKYASESAKLSSYKTLTTRFRDTYEREAPFVGPGTDCNAQRARSQDAWRKSAYPDLIKMHDLMAEYMATLAVLAGDNTFDLSKPIAGLGDSIKKHPHLGIEAAQVDAYIKLGSIVAGLATRGMQQKAIGETVTRADPLVQDLLEGMSVMLDVYHINNSKERGCVVDFLTQESTIAMRSRRTALVGVLGRELAKEKTAEYAANARGIEKASEGIEAMRKGHAELRMNVNSLSSKELAAALKELSNEIRDARKALDALS